MKPLNPLYVMTGSRTIRHRFYLLAAAVEGSLAAALTGYAAWLIVMRPSEANGLAGYSERHVFGFLVRYLSLDDEAVINALMLSLMVATLLVVIMLGWLWHRRLTHMLPPPETGTTPDLHGDEGHDRVSQA